MTVLGAKTTTRVLQHAQLDASSEGGFANLKSGPEQIPHLFVPNAQEGACPIARECFTAENIVREGR